jgi:hypothetical protein
MSRVCRTCDLPKAKEDFYKGRASCIECRKKWDAEYRRLHSARISDRKKGEHRAKRPRNLEKMRAYYESNRVRLLAKIKVRSLALKAAAYAAYGGYCCACCGETQPEFLCIDHVNNDGYLHRSVMRAGMLYRWLKDQGYPPGFQILCFNCNQGKRLNGGVCPHKGCGTGARPAIFGIQIRET